MNPSRHRVRNRQGDVSALGSTRKRTEWRIFWRWSSSLVLIFILILQRESMPITNLSLYFEILEESNNASKSVGKTAESRPHQSGGQEDGEDWIQRQLRRHNQTSMQETTLIKCVGTSGFDETCLFRDMYWIQGEKFPTAIVLKQSKSHRKIKALKPTNLLGTYDRTHQLPIIRTVSSLQELQAKYANAQLVSGLTAYYDSECPSNVGHGIWDGLWPIFVGLKQLGLPDHVPFQPLMHNLGRKHKKQFNMTKAITTAIALGKDHMFGEPMNYNPKRIKRLFSSLKDTYRLELFAMGSGHRGQRTMNRQYSLPGGEYLQSFRGRTLQGFGLPPSQPLPYCTNTSKRKTSPDGNQQPAITLQVAIFDNVRFGSSERIAMQKLAQENQQWVSHKNSSGLHIRFVDWRNYSVVQQMELISKTDIYVSGPGTGIMFSPFARDGSVVINLGDWRASGYGKIHPAFWEEYLVQGASYQRGLFYNRCANSVVTKQALWDLIRSAERIIRSCEHFGTTGMKVADENRSPIVRAMRELFDVLGLPGNATRNPKSLSNENRIRLENDILRGPRLDKCTWAERLIFEPSTCVGIWKRYQWDELVYKETARQLRAKYGLTTAFCQAWGETTFSPSIRNESENSAQRKT